MIIDNFDLFRSHLTFQDPGGRYIVQIIKRGKDGNVEVSHERSRLIKTYEICSLDYFDGKRESIKDLCRSNGARAYILPQVRSAYECLKEMIRQCVDSMDNPTVKFNHILRSSLCAMHKSRDKMWVLDLDDDCMTEYWAIMGFPNNFMRSRTWTVEEVMNLVASSLESCGKSKDDAYIVKTKSGHHIVTRPFNLLEAYHECRLMFEGDRTWDLGGSVGSEGVDRTHYNGWLHKDGMSILYMELNETEKQA